jgi:hypothetical protein
LNEEFNWCDKDVKWEVEIDSWTDELILLDVETEFMKCTSPIQLEFVYDSQIDHLRHNNSDLDNDLEKAIINYLDSNS